MTHLRRTPSPTPSVVLPSKVAATERVAVASCPTWYPSWSDCRYHVKGGYCGSRAVGVCSDCSEGVCEAHVQFHRVVRRADGSVV